MPISNESGCEKQSSLLPPVYSSHFLKAAKASNYFIIPSPSPASEAESLLTNTNKTQSTQLGDKCTHPTPKKDDQTPNRYILFTYPEPLRAYRTSTNSLVASVFAVILGFPLDSVKTRLQAYKYKGTWDCIVNTYKNEGIPGFYRGLTAPLVSTYNQGLLALYT